MKNIIICLLLLILLGSCATKKDIIYYQDIDDKELSDINDIQPKTEIEINDILQVTIQTLNPESAIPFNKTSGMGGGAGSTGGGGGGQSGFIKLQGYVVDQSGEIDMPVIGKVRIVGLSIEDAERKIKAKLISYLKNPYVSVRYLNYKFTVQGEVRNPGTFEVFESNVTLPQALGLAGDLTIKGKREDILIIRTLGNQRIVRRIDMTQSDWMNSPFYFIRQNDVIYVEPNKPQVSTAGYITGVGPLLGLVSFAITITLLLTR